MVISGFSTLFYHTVLSFVYIFFYELYSWYVGHLEAGSALFILGLPTTLIVAASGAIIQKIGYFGWLCVCTILFFINWFCVLVGLFTFKKFYQKLILKK